MVYHKSNKWSNWYDTSCPWLDMHRSRPTLSRHNGNRCQNNHQTCRFLPFLTQFLLLKLQPSKTKRETIEHKAFEKYFFLGFRHAYWFGRSYFIGQSCSRSIFEFWIEAIERFVYLSIGKRLAAGNRNGRRCFWSNRFVCFYSSSHCKWIDTRVWKFELDNICLKMEQPYKYLIGHFSMVME